MLLEEMKAKMLNIYYGGNKLATDLWKDQARGYWLRLENLLAEVPVDWQEPDKNMR